MLFIAPTHAIWLAAFNSSELYQFLGANKNFVSNKLREFNSVDALLSLSDKHKIVFDIHTFCDKIHLLLHRYGHHSIAKREEHHAAFKKRHLDQTVEKPPCGLRPKR